MSFNKFEYFSDEELLVLTNCLVGECAMYMDMADDGVAHAEKVISVIVSMSEDLLVEVKARRAIVGAELDQLLAELTDIDTET